VEAQQPDLTGLRDRALIGVMVYTFARVNAVLQMKVRDYFVQGSFGISNVDARQISRIVFHPQPFLQRAGPRAQNVTPVANLVKVNAIPLNQAGDGGQEIQKNSSAFGG
jgi:hypothetical protein